MGAMWHCMLVNNAHDATESKGTLHQSSRGENPESHAIIFYLIRSYPEREYDIMVELPEVRDLTEEEIEYLKSNPKCVDGKLQLNINDAGTIQEGTIDVRLISPEEFPFSVQTLMELVVKIILPSNKFNFFYRVKSTGQIIRMYHNRPGHDDVDGKINGSHKHHWKTRWTRKAYAINDIDPEKPIKAIQDFCDEESIILNDPVASFFKQDSLDGWL